MKKYLIVVFCVLLLILVTGCGSKKQAGSAYQVECTGIGTLNDGSELKTEIVANFDKNNNLNDATLVYNLGNNIKADEYCDFYKTKNDTSRGIEVSCSGLTVTMKGYNVFTNINGKTRDEFVQLMKDGNLTCK